MGNGSPRVTVNSVLNENIFGAFIILQSNFIHQDWKVRESVNVCLVEKKKLLFVGVIYAPLAKA